MLPFKLIYHDKYDLNLGPHVFPSQKFRLISEAVVREEIATPEDFLQPSPATDEDILRVHTPEWTRKLKTGTLTASDVMLLEIPYSRELVEAVWLAAGGSILAGQCALRDGFGANLGGGFHHAYPDHGEGFCVLNDVAVAVAKLRVEGAIERAAIIDLDVHQGNGTAAIFEGTDEVFTFSMHGERNYPTAKMRSDLDVALKDGVGDAEYLDSLQCHLPALKAGGAAKLCWNRLDKGTYRR